MAGSELRASRLGAPEYPVFPQCLPDPLGDSGRYAVRFASTHAELDEIQKLRYEVFNVELGEGLEESHATGRDRDRFDPVCHHLLVIDRSADRVVGTYRLQTSAMADRHEGFYSADEFRLTLPPSVLDSAIEVGRASVARAYRNRQVLFLLWRGLAAYMQQNRKRYLFGCCSLTSQDPVEGKRVMEHLERTGQVHTGLQVTPHDDWRCYDDDFRLTVEQSGQPVALPKLFRLYLRYGARVLGPPALDRFFKTIDYLVMLDVEALDESTRRIYFR